MKSVLGADQKPNCLIIDEIDGAPTVRAGGCVGLPSSRLLSLLRQDRPDVTPEGPAFMFH